jgi:hypothetical protein
VAIAMALLYLLPALLLLVLLIARRYPGQRQLVALARKKREAWPRRPGLAPRPPRVATTLPRGGLLIACSIAVRPPPASSVAMY